MMLLTRTAKRPPRALALACVLASFLLATATPAIAAAGGRRALHQQDGDEPSASPGRSLVDDTAAADPLALPSGQGPLYSTTATITSALERWAAASSSNNANNNGRMRLLKLPDPLNLPAGSPNGSPSYGAALTAVRFTDPATPSSAKRRAVLTCSTHARELITGETCFALVRLLAGAEDGVVAAAASASAASSSSSSSPAASSSPSAALWKWREMREAMRAAGLITRAEAASATSAASAFKLRVAPQIARELDLSILPVVNAAGRDLIEQSPNYYSLRKTVDARNLTGRPQVDPNRSYPWKWERNGPGSEYSETFSGDNQAWPWEVRAVASLLGNDNDAAGPGSKKQLDAAIDVHSGIHALLYPYGYTCDLAGLPAEHLDLWQRASDSAKGAWGEIIVGPTSSALYLAAGTTSEFAYGALGASLAATPEIYSGVGDGKNMACPAMKGWAEACSGSEDVGGACACAVQSGADAPAAECKSTVQSSGGDDGASSARRPGSSSALSRFGGGELTPTEVLLEAQILRRVAGGGESAAADAAEAEAAAALGLDVPSARATAASYFGPDPEEANSAHYQPGKWPAGVTPGVDLADAIQMGEPVRAAGEQWYARDPYLRHWPKATRGAKSTLAFFNPVTASEYRKTVSQYSVGILAMLLTPNEAA